MKKFRTIDTFRMEGPLSVANAEIMAFNDCQGTWIYVGCYLLERLFNEYPLEGYVE